MLVQLHSEGLKIVKMYTLLAYAISLFGYFFLLYARFFFVAVLLAFSYLRTSIAVIC
jgi:hypothetical protein